MLKGLKALGVVLVVSGMAWTARRLALDGPWQADMRTGAGQRTRMTLTDGSRVELNSGTAIAVRFGDDERALHLLKGEILVTTAQDAADRPFLVYTPQGRLHAQGTRFSVRALEDSDIGLAVFDGAVEIQPAQTSSAPLLLRAHEQTRFTRAMIAPVSPADDSDIAWTQGLLVAQDMPLSRFLGELARHRPGHLGHAPAVANLRVSGVYPLADTDQVLAVLEQTLPIKVWRVSRYWTSVQPR